MATAQRRLVIQAFIDVLEAITLGAGRTLSVGDGKDPNHERPYAIVTLIPGGKFTGPMSDLNADEELRLQVSGVGETAEQANAVCDKARLALSRSSMDTAMVALSANRQILTFDIDFGMSARYERGMTEPTFVAFDQYVLSTTWIPAPD